jgi:hypothetical protein
VTSDLNVDNTVTVTVTGSMGFTGDVTLAATAADAGSVAITDWSATLATTTVTLTADGTQTAMLTLKAMGDTAALAGNLTVTATSTADPATAAVAVTFNPVLHVVFADNGAGTVVYPPHAINNPYLLKIGRQMAVYNGSSTKILVVHTNNVITGLSHEGSSPGTAPGAAYLNTLTGAAGDEDNFYCHNDTATTTELLNTGP